MEESKVQVEVLPDSKLIVWSPKESRRLYSSGYYGKPLGIAKPKEEFDVPLLLDPIEGVYLLEKDQIQVYSGKDHKDITLEDLKAIARNTLERFDEKYIVYFDLREKGFVVTPGIKYGCDFAVYEHGPGVDHAPFIVQVRRSDDSLTASNIVEAGRLATSVRKTFIIAMVEDKNIKYLGFKWWRP